MKIDKSHIIDLLRIRGEDLRAAEAEEVLPVTVDTEEHKDLLDRFGLDEQAIRGGITDRRAEGWVDGLGDAG